MSNNGSFSTAFAQKKHWKLDEKLMDAIKEVLVPAPDSSVIDLGAGIGLCVEALQVAGWKHVCGVDGIEGIVEISNGLIARLDLTEPRLWTRKYFGSGMVAGWRPDAAICIEVGEHIPPEKQKAFLDNLADAALYQLIVSYAVPGQRGRDHVSCHTPEWVASQLASRDRGWIVHEGRTKIARDIAGKGWDKKLLVMAIGE